MLLVVVSMHVLAAVFGALYQMIVTHNDHRKFPPPGVLVNAAGRELHLVCTGLSSPTVILEAAMPGGAANWAWVQPQVAENARVCAYDRAGMGWSERGQEPRDANRIADELRALLEAANIEGPYVLVGHSLGGLYVRAHVALHPDDVVGVVLIDSTHPDLWQRLPRELALPGDAVLSIFTPMAWIGLTRFYTPFPVDPGLPEAQRRELGALQSTVRVVATIAAELKAIPATIEQVKATGLRDIPLVVLTAGIAYPKMPPEIADPAKQVWSQLQAELTGLSTNSVQRIVPRATHESLVYNEADAQFTIDAIRDVVEAARTGTMLTSGHEG